MWEQTLKTRKVERSEFDLGIIYINDLKKLISIRESYPMFIYLAVESESPTLTR